MSNLLCSYCIMHVHKITNLIEQVLEQEDQEFWESVKTQVNISAERLTEK